MRFLALIALASCVVPQSFAQEKAKSTPSLAGASGSGSTGGAGSEPRIEKGTVAFTPGDDQTGIPERYRLQAHRFDYTMALKRDLPITGVEIYDVRFESPVKTAWPENNTVHAEYYKPKKAGPFPCVVVLDILAGNQKLPQAFCQHLAQSGIGGLFVQMPYYGPRRPQAGKVRMLSYDVHHSIEAVRQSVLDMRRAAAWMESRPEVDKERLGIMGISLGSFMAALTAEMEPKFGRVGVLLGGGGFVDGYYDDPRAMPYRKLWEAVGGNKEQVAKFLAPIDPLTYAERLKSRKVLMVAAKNDEIVPPRMAENLWNASGRQQIIWLDAGHITAIIYLPTGMKYMADHFGAPAGK